MPIGPKKQAAFSAEASSLRHLLQTNNPPSDFEAQMLRNILLDAHESLNLCCAPSQEHDEIRAFIEAHTVILSAVRRFPPEILSAIFRLVELNPKRYNYTYNVFDVTRGPWPISRVCSSWRTVAVSNPTLWSSMELDCDYNRPKYTPRPKDALSLLKAVLQLSGQHPLHFILHDEDLEEEVFPELIRHSNRWKNVDFCMSPPLLLALQPVAATLTSLSKLNLNVRWQLCPAGYLPDGIDVFKGASQLRSSSLTGLSDAYRTFNLPWNHLTSLRLQSIPQPSLHTVLRAAPNLKDFKASMEEYDPLTHVDATELVHSSLREITLDGYGAVMPHNIVLPNLTDLCIYSQVSDDWDQCHPDALPSLSALLRRSRCSSLKRLDLGDFEVDYPKLLALIEEAPTITELSMSCSYFKKDDDRCLGRLIEAMVYRPHTEAAVLILSKLEILKIHLWRLHDKHVEFVNSTLCQLIDSRTNVALSQSQGPDRPVGAVATLRRVSIYANDEDAEYPRLRTVDIDSLKIHQSSGCKISIKTESKHPSHHFSIVRRGSQI